MSFRRLWRALSSRWGSTGLVAVVAICAVAAAVAAPTYEAAARTSIVHDTFARASTVERGVQVQTTTGLAADISAALGASLVTALDDGLGASTAHRLFAPPTLSIESNIYLPTVAQPVLLASRTGVCDHVRLERGTCPRRPDDIVISTSLAQVLRIAMGQVVHPIGWPAMHVVGIYAPIGLGSQYWFSRETTYFPYERPRRVDLDAPPAFDVAFTTVATMTSDETRQGTFVATTALTNSNVRPGDIDTITTAANDLDKNPALSASTIATELPAAADTVHAGWRSLRVPVVVIAAELVLLAWLLLFVLVAGIADARADEVALARLRGQGGSRVLVIGLGEPLLLLVLAFPLGTLAGWGIGALLASATLRPGTPTSLPAVAWVTAAVTVGGGVLAMVAAAWRALRTEVVRSRQTSRHTGGRGWILDAVVVTAAVGGLVQLLASGSVSRTSNSGIVLLVPAFAVLAAAIVASRGLPMVCRALFRVTSDRGPISLFLAVRAIARRVSDTRTVMLVATATGLLTFAVAAWSSGNVNRDHVAVAELGAPRVLTVAVPDAVDLATAVTAADPTGRQASAVITYDGGEARLLAVQPQRFANVAGWSAVLGSRPSASTLQALHPSVPTPIVLQGEHVQLSLSVSGLSTRADVSLDVLTSTSGATTPIDLGMVGPGSSTRQLTADLLGRPCRLLAVRLSPLPGNTLTGAAVITGLSTSSPSGSTAVPGIADLRRWSTTSPDVTKAVAQGLLWSFREGRNTDATLRVVDHPAPVPAIVSRDLPADSVISDLDGTPLQVVAVARPRAIPGISAGVVVPLDYARLAALSNDFSNATDQVWLTADASPDVERRLTAAGVHVVVRQDASAISAELQREGPGLAALLYVVNAAAATTLAALGAVAGFWANGRRRRYEYAALLANNLRRTTIRSAVLVEQLLTLLFAAVVGVAVGYGVAIAVLPDLPQFVTPPTTPLDYTPPVGVMTLAIVVAVAVMAGAAAAAGSLLVRLVRPDLLREGAE